MSPENNLWIPPEVGDALSLRREVMTPEELQRTSVREIIIAQPNGPCRGVLATWRDARESLQIINGREPVYIHNPLVHNRAANEEFRRMGLVVVEDRLPNGDWDFDAIPDNSIYWISAHGSKRPKDALRAMAKGCLVQDFACPLVDAEQNAIRAAITRGENVFFFGKEGHPESRGAEDLIPEGRGGRISSLDDLEKMKYDPTKKTNIKNQTTQSTWEIRKYREAAKAMIPLIQIQSRGDGCYATDDRQEAVVNLREKVDAFLVITDGISNNGTNLVIRAGEERADGSRIPSELIYGAKDLDLPGRYSVGSGIETVGISAAASTSPADIEAVIAEFQENGALISYQATDKIEKDPFMLMRANKYGLYVRYGLRLPEYSVS
jgi:4-hydroxy-3-methylbut-2-en-1-yl diphosphate reductase